MVILCWTQWCFKLIGISSFFKVWPRAAPSRDCTQVCMESPLNLSISFAWNSPRSPRYHAHPTPVSETQAWVRSSKGFQMSDLQVAKDPTSHTAQEFLPDERGSDANLNSAPATQGSTWTQHLSAERLLLSHEGCWDSWPPEKRNSIWG